MAVLDLSPHKEQITGFDGVVIRKFIAGIHGGAALNVENYSQSVIKAGHLIVKNTGTNEYSPMPIKGDGSGYGELPAGTVYAGVLVSSISKDKPSASVMTRGEVNSEAAPFKYPDDAVDTLKHIVFTKDTIAE